MKHIRGFLLIVGLAIAAVTITLIVKETTRKGVVPMEPNQENSAMSLTSPAFTENGQIPIKYTCKGENISPPLAIGNVPPGTQSVALIMHDPDAPTGDWVHWTLWNIPAESRDIAERTVPAGAVQGTTSFNTIGYGGPCPPQGIHRYVFDIYALNTKLDLPASTTRDQLLKAMEGHTAGQATLTGKFAAEAAARTEPNR
jgi:Raf kinase inhibitor-like YbhB/YbcL family protein